MAVRDGSALEEEGGLPRSIVSAVQDLFGATRWIFDSSALSMGGGTVLQARWKHRVSTDADLFCDPMAYHNAVRSSVDALEGALRELADAPQRLLVDPMGLYVEIGGVETTITPAFLPVGERTRRMVPGTSIETWSSADILAGKLLYRLLDKGAVEPRDLYDLAAAAHQDPRALERAVGVLSRRQRRLVCKRLELLPERWADSSAKPLLGLPDSPFEYSPGLIAQRIRDAGQGGAGFGAESDHASG